MTAFLLLYFLHINEPLFSDGKKLLISGHEFKVVQSIESEDSPEMVTLNLYRTDSSNTTMLLKHVVKELWGDCNSIPLQLGTYSVTDTSVTFYSFWCRTGDAPVSPYGARKQLYVADRNGVLRMRSSQIYIETSRKDWHENKGIKYLFTKPINAEEQAALEAYIKNVEQQYNAKFVIGGNDLLSEVKEKLKKEIERETSTWEENGFLGTKI